MVVARIYECQYCSTSTEDGVFLMSQRFFYRMSRSAMVVCVALLAACAGHAGSVVPTTQGYAQSPVVPPTGSLTTGAPHILFERGSVGATSQFTTQICGWCRKNSMANMTYGGGPLLLNPKVYLVLWGNWQTADSFGEAGYLNRFFAGVGGTSWASTLTQYSSRSGAITNTPNILKGVWNDTTTPPASLSDSVAAQEALAARQHFLGGISDPDALFVVATPENVANGVQGACAWHNAATGGIPYVALPYLANYTPCGAQMFGSALDGVSIVAGHELAEAMTDPEPWTGWADLSKQEIGDKCGWDGLYQAQLANGTYPMQPVWSNAIAGCAPWQPMTSIVTNPKTFSAGRGATEPIMLTCTVNGTASSCDGVMGAVTGGTGGGYVYGQGNQWYIHTSALGSLQVTFTFFSSTAIVGVKILTFVP